MKTPPDLLDQIAFAAPLAAKLQAVRAGAAVTFEHVVGTAQPTLAAILARAVKKRVWVICPNVRAQETFHNELLQWFPDALFFPETELAAVEGAVSDPESSAERLGIVQKLTAGQGRQLVVLTEASLDDDVPSATALRKLEISLRRATRLDREALVKKLAAAGYEHVAQVSARGQFAVRGGILDVFSFHHALPVRIELFDDEIESLREFDLDTQTSVQQLESCTLLLGEASDPRGTGPLRDLIRDGDLTIDAGAGWSAANVRILEAAEHAEDSGVADSAEEEATDATEDLTTDHADFTDGREAGTPNSSSVSSVPSVVPSSASSPVQGGEDFPTGAGEEATDATEDLTTDHADFTDGREAGTPNSSSVSSVPSVVPSSASSPVQGGEDFPTGAGEEATDATEDLTTDHADFTDGREAGTPNSSSVSSVPSVVPSSASSPVLGGEDFPTGAEEETTDATEDLTTDHADFTDGREAGTPDSSSVSSVPSVVPSSASSPILGGEDFSTAFFEHGLGEFEAGDFVIDELKRERFFRQLREWREAGWTTHIFCNNEGEIERLNDLIPPVETDLITFTIGTLAGGFTFPAARVAVLSDAELFGRYRNTRARRIALRRAREQASRAQIDFSELNEDDIVVHLEHGIGRYEGMKSIPGADGKAEEVLVLAFADDARMYVPLEQSFLISRYVGVGKRNPGLSTLGDGKWARARKNAEKAVFDYAAKLLQVHAERETAKGHAFPPDNKWQREFEASFLFKETPDQLNAIHAAKADMEAERPMDRLICGDVGFGKTEVAIRAAFKSVMGGKQVAILVPTTVLAEQHYRNFRERMSDYPVTVELLSRFRSPAEQRKTVAGLLDGRVDIVVGTHRLISKDIAFKNLGLVVIDEEQRFGVLHKEKFKEMFQLVDLLTLSATPIPRTLYLSLMGAKDMSTIETPPLNRIPTETLICPYDERIIRDAINRELARQGQVYFLHNRVGSIEAMRDKIRKLCPKARCVIGHGQMDEHELEDVMHQFVSGAADVLVSTTIIESGLDIPNANTIIIDRADRFGLADLYQLRGRVGRAQHKAYAYLLLPRDMLTQGEARRRINAIKQYSSLGAGFKIAMRDLEIRGAGNILGTQQSGHIVNIGFDLYCSLLKQAVSKLKGEKVRSRLEVTLRTDFLATREADFFKAKSEMLPAFLPASYIAEAQPRIQAYRRLAEIATHEQLDALRKTWRDRFGKPPSAVEHLLLTTEIKLAAAARKISIVEVREAKVMLTRNGQFVQIDGKFPRLASPDPAARLRELLALIRAF